MKTHGYLVQASWATARGKMGGTSFLVRAPDLDAATRKARPRVYRSGRSKIDMKVTLRPELNAWP